MTKLISEILKEPKKKKMLHNYYQKQREKKKNTIDQSYAFQQDIK